MSVSDDTIKKVWEKAQIVSNNEPTIYRKDQCGAWIKRTEYGNRKSEYGWEIDHIKPDSGGGSDELSNLRPLQWENNLKKSDGKLVCAVTANNAHNVKIE
jgi:5-methylcytosine-specific restriction endonuclease McrA